MLKLKTTLFLAFLIAILYTPNASAQATAAKISIVSGNGQMFTSAPYKNVPILYPMVVKVTDASGNPIAGKTVNWQWVFSPTGGTLLQLFNFSTVTDANGLTANGASQGIQTGSVQMPYLQTVISASADGVSVNFTETQALMDGGTNNQLVFSAPGWLPGPPPTLTGPAGSTGTTPITIHIDGRGTPIPNVSVRLLSQDPKTLPSASCVTGAGADPGSVLTDASGNATCYPVFGSISGNAPVSVLVGGLDPALFDQSITSQPLSGPVAFDQYNGVQLVVTPVTPGQITIVSGNNQTVNPGQSSAPLVARVTDTTGVATIANTSVQWTVTPAGAASVSQSLTTTDSSGQTQTTVVFAPTAVGQITVKAALTGANSGISTTFNLTTNVQIASITKVSGDLQTAQAGQNFGTPLSVQVNGTNGQPVVNQPVSFVLTGGTATLSATSANTDGNGRAQITVTAGATPGTVTINAFVGNISQTFTLTIIPPGPALNTGSFYNAGGSGKLSALSACSLVTVIASGLAPNIQGLVVNSNAFGPWANTLANDSVTVNNVAAPISSVGNVSGVEQLTFQVPCDAAPASSVPITVNVGGGTGTVNLPIVAATPGIFETVMSDNVRRGVVIRPDGTFVSIQNPARRGEVVRVFVTGVGPAAPPVVTGAVPVPGSDALLLGSVIVGVNNGGTRVVSSRVSPNLIGVCEIAFQVPSDAPTGNDVVLSVDVHFADGVRLFSNGSKLPIQ